MKQRIIDKLTIDVTMPLPAYLETIHKTLLIMDNGEVFIITGYKLNENSFKSLNGFMRFVGLNKQEFEERYTSTSYEAKMIFNTLREVTLNLNKVYIYK